jgi:hypothetical protein
LILLTKRPNPNRRHPNVWPTKKRRRQKSRYLQPLYKTFIASTIFSSPFLSLSLCLIQSLRAASLRSAQSHFTSSPCEPLSLSALFLYNIYVYFIYVCLNLDLGLGLGLDLKLFVKFWLKLCAFCILHCRFDVFYGNPFGCLLCTTCFLFFAFEVFHRSVTSRTFIGVIYRYPFGCLLHRMLMLEKRLISGCVS